jgi:hypothetical protein
VETKKYLIISMAVLVWACPGRAVLDEKIFTSSGQILPGEEWNSVYVYNDDTVVDMLGGFVEGLATYDASTVNVTGGEIKTLDATDFSSANVSGGQVRSLSAFEWATVQLSDGASVVSLIARDTGVVSMTGGTADVAGALESGILNIFGGIVTDAIGGNYSGSVNMTAGVTQRASFRGEAGADFYGGTISDYLIATDDSTVNIWGYGLLLTSSGGTYGYGQVNGYWLDDTPFTINLNGVDTYTHINLIPEPASCLLLGLGALLLRRERGIPERVIYL